jgi:hypothetical protein
VAEWREQFGANGSELRNLLEFASERRRSIGASLIAGETVEILFPTSSSDVGRSDATLHPEDETDMPPILVRARDLSIGHIPLMYVDDVLSWIRGGAELQTTVEVEAGIATVRFRLVPAEDD